MILLLLAGLSLWTSAPSAQEMSIPAAPTTAPRGEPENYIRAPRLGVTFVNSAQLVQEREPRYENALLIGAGWTRWPLYWDEAEPEPGQWNWSAYDELVTMDTQYGLSINAVLIGRPSFYADGAIMQGLNAPVFADGSDTLRDTSTINPDNKWAQFVYEAVQRYKPGGTLAQERGWGNNRGVRVWEMWNEPDYQPFWSGGIANYARLLKVGWLAAHHADPNATVMFGGMLYNTPDNWLARVLAIYANDPLREEHNWYMDAVALHSYSYPWRTGWLTLFTEQTLIAYDLDRPLFVNETGLSVWDDYPGPVWVDSPEERLKLGTAEQQAWFFIQSTAYAWAEGADVVFFHQLYDDCGDQPAGTDFPPHDGSLCANGGRCFGDAFGLFRNTTDALCYSQHPRPGSPRPAATAFRLMANVFGQPFEGGDVTRQNGITQINFRRPATNERIRVIWNLRFERQDVQIEASAASAQLHTLRGTRTINASNGAYNLALAAAEPDSYPDLEAADISAVGGEPVILVERVRGGFSSDAGTNTLLQSEPASGIPTPQQRVMPTPGAVLQQPTTAPADDTLPPTTSMQPLEPVSPPTFDVQWSADDDGAVQQYMVWVQVNDGEWTPWLETTRTSGTYTGIAGNTYRFAVWAQDAAGNWSANTDLTPQAETRIESGG
jgi:hypothetical protein